MREFKDAILKVLESSNYALTKKQIKEKLNIGCSVSILGRTLTKMYKDGEIHREILGNSFALYRKGGVAVCSPFQ